MKQGFVYWIHLPEHTNIKTQGYVGVATDYRMRWAQHKHAATSSKSKNPHLSNAINKHQSNLVYEVIFNGPMEGCYHIEEYFRPTNDIGWNIRPGGLVVPISENMKLKMSISAKARVARNDNPNLRKGIPEGCIHPMKNKIHSDESKHKMSLSNKKSCKVIHIETGHTYNSVKAAHRNVPNISDTSILYSCKTGKTIKGTTWSFV